MNMVVVFIRRNLIFPVFQVKWPNGISIDSVAERVYWVDAALDFIASVNLDGGDFKKVFLFFFISSFFNYF